MNLIVPTHQYEVRFTNLLNFAVDVKGVLSPFIPLASNIQIEREGSTNARYTLYFENDNYSIISSWDRLVFKYEGDIKNLTENNSIVETPFFAILDKLTQLKDFGKLNNYLFFSLFINYCEINDEKKIISDFSSKYLNIDGIKKIFNNHTDTAIIIEEKVGKKQNTIHLGPYLGVEDLNKRKIIPITKNVIENSIKFGEMAEIKIFEPTTKITFNEYKNASRETFQLIDKLWKK